MRKGLTGKVGVVASEQRRSARLTSVSVGGLVEHEHGIVDLEGDKQDGFTLRFRSLSPLPHGILPDLSPSQVLQGRLCNRWTDAQRKGRGRRRRRRRKKKKTGGRRQVMKEEAKRAKYERTTRERGLAGYVPNAHNGWHAKLEVTAEAPAQQSPSGST